MLLFALDEEKVIVLTLFLSLLEKKTMLPQQLSTLSRSLSTLARGLEFELLFVSAAGALFFIIKNLEVRRKAQRGGRFWVPAARGGSRIDHRSPDAFPLSTLFFSRSPFSLPALFLLLSPLSLLLAARLDSPKQFGSRATSEL